MIESPPPPTNSRALLPNFRSNCQDDSHFAQMGSHFAQNATPSPIFYSAVTRSCRDMYKHKHPQPHPKTLHFLA